MRHWSVSSRSVAWLALPAVFMAILLPVSAGTMGGVEVGLHARDSILFVSNRAGSQDIYLLQGPSGSVTQLTDAAGDDFDPVWSSDGQTIFFTSRRDGGSAIYRMNPDGRAQRRITGGPGLDYGARLRPGDDVLLFASTRANPTRLFVLDLKSGSASLLHESIANPVGYSWSPDGRRIAVHLRIPGEQRSRLMFVNWPERTVESTVDLGSGTLGEFVWAPDGRQLAYTVGTGRYYELKLLDVASLDSISLDAVAGNVQGPSWSPDGHWLAYASTGSADRRQSRNHVFALRVDGGFDARPHVVTRSQADDERPVWMRDSQRIVFVSFRSGAPRLFLGSVMGEEPRMISDGPGQDTWPVVRPKVQDGGRGVAALE